jgi:hypothetical protein
MSVILATWEASPGKQFTRPISKISRAKWTGGVAQAVECLLCKHKALNSNPVPPKKEEKKVVSDTS